MDLEKAKYRLKEYLQAKGVPHTGNPYRCPSPHHVDNDPTAHLYEDGGKPPRVLCPVCSPAKAWSIFDIAGVMIGSNDFKEQVKEVKAVLGIQDDFKKPEAGPVALAPEQAKNIYTENSIMAMYSFKKWGTHIVGIWKYKTAEGKIKACDVRIEGGQKGKIVVTVWYDGRRLRADKAPVLIYNLPEILNVKTGARVWFHEGAKCGNIARSIPGWIPGAWNGGGGKAEKVDLKPLVSAGIKEVWYYPDIDLKCTPAGKMRPWYEQPGMKYAKSFRNHCRKSGILCHVIKPMEVPNVDGADIEDALKLHELEAVGEYLKSPPEIVFPGDIEQVPATTTKKPDNQTLHAEVPKDNPGFPFRVLGIADDGKAHFIGRHGRMCSFGLANITKNQLLLLAPEEWWFQNYADGSRSWTTPALDDVLEVVMQIDFNQGNLQGRGARRTSNGFIYWDGFKMYGEPEKEKVYLRSPRQDIGLDSPPATFELIRDMMDAAGQISFASPADAIYALSIGAIGAFCGCLKARPIFLLTGGAGEGKSTIAEDIIKPLALSVFGDKTCTVPGIQGQVKNDARHVIIDELESNEDRENIMNLARSSYMENAPLTLKGLKDGGARSVSTSCMFGLIGINPDTGNEANWQRTFIISTKKPEDGQDWPSLERKIKQLFSEENCKSVRSLVWQKLPEIFKLTDTIQPEVARMTKRNFRYCYAQALLIAVYFIIWFQPEEEDLDVNFIKSFLKEFYVWKPLEVRESEPELLLKRILSEVVFISQSRTQRTLRSIMKIIKDGHLPGDDDELDGPTVGVYKRTAGLYGLAWVTADSENVLAIENKNHMIVKITGESASYHKVLERHKKMLYKGRTVNIPGQGTTRATTFKGVI